jgi:ribosome maturation factor RimP
MAATEHQAVIAGVDLDRVRAALGPVLSAHDVALADLEFVTDRQGWTLRLTIERPGPDEVSGNVTLDDCAEVSRDASLVLDVEDLIAQHYNLEVSSPGLDRRLRTPADFARFTGKTARVKLRAPAPDGQRLLRGALDPAPDGVVAVIVDGKRIETPFENVEQANLVFELVPQPKKGSGKTTQKPGAAKRARPKS